MAVAVVSADSSRGDAPTRRERVRAATIEEIKTHAWSQVASGGPTSVSLRSIAHEMGMTSSALYRYFDSHEQLLTELAADALGELADALEKCEAADVESNAASRFVAIATAYRAWSIENAPAYALVFGTPMSKVCMNPRVEPEFRRGVAVLFRVMIDGIANGEVDVFRLPKPSRLYATQLEDFGRHLEVPLSTEALAACMFGWTQLHGAISLELFGQLPPEMTPGDEIFRAQMITVLSSFGCTLGDSAFG